MTPLESKADFVAAQSQTDAVMFLWANRSGPAHASRKLAESMIVHWRSTDRLQYLTCCVVDVSEQSGELWETIGAWLMAQGLPAGPLMMSGAGPLLWLRSGRVVLHVVAPLQYNSRQLAAVTASVFASVE